FLCIKRHPSSSQWTRRRLLERIMALRSIEITLPEGEKEQIEELLSGRKVALNIRVQRIIGVWKHPPPGELGWMR
ncbi:MAG: hypothetical protein QG605_234, partial [Euryarchaeota archaeon]|nr:hypothetical protein [Euryarchaeota archaeon]